MAYAAFIYLMAVISPGPNFILISRYSSLGALRLGFAVTLGICTVSGVFSIVSLLGLASVLSAYPSFTEVSVMLGSAYLTYIAYSILSSTMKKRSAVDGNANGADSIAFSWSKSYRVGALINLLNIKTIAFMISIFSGFLAIPRSIFEQVLIVAICSVLEFLWYFLVAIVFGRPLVREIFFRHRVAIDRGLALFLVIFAMQNVYQIM